MQVILDSILFITLLSITTNPHSVLANFKHGLRANESKDYEALLAIKGEISGDPHSVLSSWNNSLHFCNWEGVTCGRRHRRVVSLILQSHNLVGTLSPFIGNLSFLHVLDLYDNSFRGDIPHQISQLPRLKVLYLMSNSFEGEIPANLSRCTRLTVLFLSFNNLAGRIPREVATLPNLVKMSLASNNFSGPLEAIGMGNMSTSLQVLYLDRNQLQGSIPNDIGRLQSLQFLALGDTLLSGAIPTSLFNISSLISLYLSRAKVHGSLPHDIGLRLPNLAYLFMTGCSLTGQFPASVSNLSMLQTLSIGFNNFAGGFYLNGNNLPHLSHLKIDSAFSLGGDQAGDLSFLDTLTNCTNLTAVLIGGNSFTGTFPISILNFSTSLEILELHHNQISGQLPPGLGKFVNLYALDLVYNNFLGPIPTDVCKLKSIERLYFSDNNFLGEIPSCLGNLTRLSDLYLEFNNLEAALPKSLGSCQSLQNLFLYSNKLSGVLPVELFHASSLLSLVIGQNNLQGPIPVEINNLKNLVQFDASQNRFSGEIPSTLGVCTSLTSLDMSRNYFVGSIPESLSPLESVQELDLSYNNLSGPIPSYLSTWRYLLSLNLSFNNLEGEVPTNGVFAKTSDVLIVGNSKLCGGVLQLHLPKCPLQRELRRKRLSLAVTLIISIVCAFIITLAVGWCIYFLRSSRKRKDAPSELHNITTPFLQVSYQMLSRATNGFSSSNLIGVGSFGYVYKGTLHQDGTELVVAVKVMNFHNKGASKSFIAECRALRNIRHRNLVKIITACSSIDARRNDFKALVYEFMPRGSLESWLYPSNPSEQSLSLFQRLNIASDVACALEYLHIGCSTPIIHCDLKPSNILLDDEMTARVGDFGLSKFAPGASTSNTTDHTSSSQVRGTVGYTAPEYGLGSKASPEGDIYSFGIIVLEMMTSKKPTDPMFSDGINLHEFAKSALPNRVMEIIDRKMLEDAKMLPASTCVDTKKIECMKSLIMVGVQCSLEVPQERMSIVDVVNELKSARLNLPGWRHELKRRLIVARVRPVLRRFGDRYLIDYYNIFLESGPAQRVKLNDIMT